MHSERLRCLCKAIKSQRWLLWHIWGRTTIVQGEEGGGVPGQKTQGVNVRLAKASRVAIYSSVKKQTEPLRAHSHAPDQHPREPLSSLCRSHPREVKWCHCTCNCRLLLVLERHSGGFPGSKNISRHDAKWAQPLGWQDAPSWGLFTFIASLFPLTLEFRKQFRLTYNLSLCSYFALDLIVLSSAWGLKQESGEFPFKTINVYF